MDILISARALRRLQDQLKQCAPDAVFLALEDDGSVTRDGDVLAEAEVQPTLGWMSGDILAQRKMDDFFRCMLASPKAAWIQTAHAGLDLGGYGALQEKGIRISNSNAQAPAIAEYILANVMAVYQQLDQQTDLQRAGTWKPLRFREVAGTRWLIIGLGNIGLETAQRAHALGADVVGIRRRAMSHPALRAVLPPFELLGQLPDADVVVLSCPLTDETRDLVDAEFVGAMKEGSVLVNIGRGGLIVDDALLSGLAENKPAHAVLDVFRIEPLPAEDPYWGHEQVRLTAHSSNAGNGTAPRGDQLFLDNLKRYLAGETLLNEVA